MKIANIKKLNEKVPDWIKLLFSRFIRNRLIHNQVFYSQYQKLNNNSALSEEEVIKEVKKCLIHAYEHTIYYHRLFHEIGFNPQEMKSLSDLERIPLLTKEILCKEYNNLAADDVKDFYEVTTGGTSGKPTKVLMEKGAVYKEWAFVYHYWSKYGYDYNISRIATLRGINFNGKWYKYNPLYAEIRLNPFQMCNDNIADYVKKIKCYHANYLYGYPSAISNFCRLCIENKVKIKGQFKAIFLISENLYSFQKKIIEDVTGAPIAIFYGHSERAVFAEKQENSGYIFNKCYGFTEIGVDNEIIATGYLNSKMPLIRYIVDDIATCMPDGTYEIIGHHLDEVLYGENGIQISMAAINFHDEVFNGVEAYQFIQNKVGECEMNVVCGCESDIDKIRNAVQKKLGKSIKCKVNKTETLQYTNRGKYKMLIQNVSSLHRKS